jgi:GTP cyclohydrolase-4
LDSRQKRELVEQFAQLRRSGVDHLDVAIRGRLQVRPGKGPGEAENRGQRGSEIVTGEQHELDKPLVVGHLLPCYGWRVEERLTAAPDLQASTPEVRIGLSRAGVTGVQKAVRMQHGGHDALVSAEIDCFVDLDPAQKGVHMSRFPEVFEEAIDEVVIDGKLLVENLAEHIAKHIVERQQALRAEVKIAARYPIERLTPVTGLRTQELVTLIGLAAASPSSTRRVVGVEATGINACPCAQGLVREEASERLGEAGFDEDDVDRILALVPLATHNQRGRGTLYLGTQVRLDAEDLVDIVEQSMSSPIYELLKRPDELFVVEHAHLTPRFVEDSVRLMVKGALDSYLELEDEDFVLARQVNFETIHNHEVLAERFGTVGELRAELANGGHSARHTELRDWLRSVS